MIHYEHTDIGYNYRMSNLLAALGRGQLSRLDDMIERRRQNRVRYANMFRGMAGVSLFGEPSTGDGGKTRDNFWLSSILVDPDEAGFRASDLQEHLSARNIEARPLWKPMHLQPVHKNRRAFTDGTSERLFATGMSLPSGSALREEEHERVASAVDEFLGNQ